MKRTNTYKGITFNVHNIYFDELKYQVERYYEKFNYWHETFIKGNTIKECIEQMKEQIDYEIELQKMFEKSK